MKRVALTTLGCKANWVDGEDILRLLAGAGFEIVPFGALADAYVINTCTVTSVADQQSRQMARRSRRTNPRALVIVTGCMGEVSREETVSMPEVSAVFGTSDRNEVVRYICENMGFNPPVLSSERRATSDERPGSRARAFLKIQDGCDRHCAYCIVPRARGKSRSVPVDEILHQAAQFGKFHREIVLTGIDIGQYGKDLRPKIGLMDLLQFLARASELPRIRISSIDPTIVDERLIELILSGKICRHVHLAIQSGSDSVLERMGRGYGAADIVRAVNLLCDSIPNIAVTGDIIAGFSGETDEEHEETRALILNLPLASLHVFPYSEREGTPAADMPERVHQKIRRARAGELRDVALKLRQKFLRGLEGSILDVIVTSKAADENGEVRGFSDNAVSVALPAGKVAYAQMGVAFVTETSGLGVKGIWNLQEKKKIRSSVLKRDSVTSSNAESI